MPNRLALLSVFALTSAALGQSTDLTYIIEGTFARAMGDGDSFLNAFFHFTGQLNSDATPFDVQAASSSYAGHSPVRVEIVGSDGADGVYFDALTHPISINVRDGKPINDLLQVWHNGYFPILVTSKDIRPRQYEFDFSFADPTGQVFNGKSVPNTDVSLEDFEIASAFLTYRDEKGREVGAYQINVTLFQIIPEPNTLALLALGVGMVLLVRRGAFA